MGLRSILLLVIALSVAQIDSQGTKSDKRVCYFTNWSQYRAGMEFLPRNVDPFLCTNIVYSFIDLVDNELELIEWNGPQLIAALQLLKRQNPDLVITTAIGGWSFGVERFSALAADDDTIEEFALSSVQFLRQYGFDGLDIDWEYPGDVARGSPSGDKQRFTALIGILQRVFAQEAASTGNKKLTLSAAVPAGLQQIQDGYEIQEVCRILDTVHLMTYDLHGSWESVTGHNAPLGGDGPNVKNSVAAWKEGGCPSNKMVLGIPLYGRSFTLSTSDRGYDAPVSGAGTPGQYTEEAGYLAYYEICNLVSSGEIIWDDDVAAPALVSGNQWIGYDDTHSVRIKTKYAMDEGMAGIMVWALDTDDFKGICGEGSFPLLSAIKRELLSEDEGEIVDTTPKDYKRVCYYTNWSQYTNQNPFFPENIDPFVCTHIVYSFIEMQNNMLKLREWNGESLIARLMDLKSVNPNLIITVAVGGWNFGTERFTALVQSDTTMEMFARTAIQFLRNHRFDGLDLDWEYPGARGSPPEDKQRFVNLIQILQRAFASDAAMTGRKKLLLSGAVPGSEESLEAGYIVPEVCSGLDYVHLMAYDIHGGGWESQTGHNAPMRGGELNVVNYVDAWLGKGCPAEKLILGVPLYGRSFTLASTANDGYDAPASNGRPGQYTNEAGYLAYYEICPLVDQSKQIWDEEVGAPAIVNGDQWIGYDDPMSIKRKVAYAKERGLGGIMVWAIDTDDFKGICHGETFPLLRAINAALNGGVIPTPHTTVTTMLPTVSSTDEPDTDEPDTGSDECYDENGNPLTTLPFKIPGVCSHYQVCSSGTLLKYPCPDGTAFSETAGICDWLANVPSCQGGTDKPTTTSRPTTHSTRPTTHSTRPTTHSTHPTTHHTRPTTHHTRPTTHPTRPHTDYTRPTTHPTNGPTHGPHPTHGPTQGPNPTIYPTMEPGCMTNKEWQKAMQKWREDYAEWSRVFDHWMANNHH